MDPVDYYDAIVVASGETARFLSDFHIPVVFDPKSFYECHLHPGHAGEKATGFMAPRTWMEATEERALVFIHFWINGGTIFIVYMFRVAFPTVDNYRFSYADMLRS